MKRISIDDLPERYQKQIREKAGDRPTGAVAKRKRDTGDEPVAKKEAARYHRSARFLGPVRITYMDFRRRLIDSDNGWTKYFTDALVSCGAIPDDDTSVIPQRPSVTQSKAKEESLVIVIEAIDERNP